MDESSKTNIVRRTCIAAPGGLALRALRSGSEFLRNDGEVHNVDHAVMVDVGTGVEAGLSGARAESSFHESDIRAVDFAVAIDVAGHLRHVSGGLGCRFGALHVTGDILGDAIEAVGVQERSRVISLGGGDLRQPGSEGAAVVGNVDGVVGETGCRVGSGPLDVEIGCGCRGGQRAHVAYGFGVDLNRLPVGYFLVTCGVDAVEQKLMNAVG